MKNINKFQNKVCELWAKSDELNKSITIVRRISESQQSIYNGSLFSAVDQYSSELHYQLSCSNESRPHFYFAHKIEPLVDLTHDPLTICTNLRTITSDLYLDDEYAVQSKRFIILGPSALFNMKLNDHFLVPPWLSYTLSNVRTPQIILFDIGSSYFNSRDDPKPGPHISGRWFMNILKTNLFCWTE